MLCSFPLPSGCGVAGWTHLWVAQGAVGAQPGIVGLGPVKWGQGLHGETTQKTSPARGHPLTLCCQSRASAQPTPTHRWLGILQERKGEPRGNRNANRLCSPQTGGSLWLSSPRRHGVLTHRNSSLSDLEFGVPNCPSYPEVHVSPRPWASSPYRVCPLKGGLSGGRKSRKECQQQVCGIGARREGTGKFLLWSDTPQRGPEDMPGSEATADLPQPTMVYQ